MSLNIDFRIMTPWQNIFSKLRSIKYSNESCTLCSWCANVLQRSSYTAYLLSHPLLVITLVLNILSEQFFSMQILIAVHLLHSINRDQTWNTFSGNMLCKGVIRASLGHGLSTTCLSLLMLYIFWRELFKRHRCYWCTCYSKISGFLMRIRGLIGAGVPDIAQWFYVRRDLENGSVRTAAAIMFPWW